MQDDNKILIEIAARAGRLILEYYSRFDGSFDIKKDQSPLTQADLASHALIVTELKKYFPNIPIISEELAEQEDYDKRKLWDYYFLVDPLDGTKEFLKRNGEFTVNIALLKQGHPIVGVVHAPVFNTTYFAAKSQGACKLVDGILTPLPKSTKSNILRIIISRSHLSDETDHYIKLISKAYEKVEMLSVGSALKFGYIAEGKADMYLRLSPTMEWDTAAGQIIVNEVGKEVRDLEGLPLKYNKPQLVNPKFIVAD